MACCTAFGDVTVETVLLTPATEEGVLYGTSILVRPWLPFPRSDSQVYARTRESGSRLHDRL